jgi:tartrate-resistant acid phosphatase type 5
VIRPLRKHHHKTPAATATFAVIGDYGYHTGIGEGPMSRMVHSWRPEFVVTTGDNNYPDGASSTIDKNVGQYFHDFIAPYKGKYGAGATANRFFPTLGNHDWNTGGAKPYIDYFALPGNERYYEFARGPVHFFMIDSDPHEPDGDTADSKQGKWLKARLAASTSPFNLVLFHHPAYSSGEHGSTGHMQWPFRAWGADAVLNGHDHDYERIMRNGFPYFVNGAGAGRRDFKKPVAGSVVRFNDFGAMLVRATRTSMRFQFYTSPTGKLIDDFTLAVRPHATAAVGRSVADVPAAAMASVFSIKAIRE